MVIKERCSFFLNKELIMALDKEAKKEDVSKSHIINRLLKDKFKEDK